MDQRERIAIQRVIFPDLLKTQSENQVHELSIKSPKAQNQNQDTSINGSSITPYSISSLGRYSLPLKSQ